MANNKYLITQEGLESLKNELKDILEAQKPQVIERVKKARDMGSLDDNPEYDAAREAQAILEGRIEELEDIIHKAKISEKTKVLKGKINVGSTVKVEIDGDKQTFTIVGSVEADPSLGKISHESPVGQALLGLQIGDEVKVKMPKGSFKYKVLEIS